MSKDRQQTDSMQTEPRLKTDRAVNEQFGTLVRLFFSRFFDKESLSPQGDPGANVVQILGVLAALGAIVSILMFCLTLTLPKTGWDIVYLRCLFLGFSLSVIGFIVVFEWDAIFPDRRDYQVLFPLPVPVWKLFLAKTTAFLLFLGMFLAALNGAVTIFWPALFEGGNFLAVMATQLAGNDSGWTFLCLRRRVDSGPAPDCASHKDFSSGRNLCTNDLNGSNGYVVPALADNRRKVPSDGRQFLRRGALDSGIPVFRPV